MTARFDRFDPAAGTPEKSRSETRPKIGPKNFSDTWFLRHFGHSAHDERFGPGLGMTLPSVRNVLSFKVLTAIPVGSASPFRVAFRLGRTWSAGQNGRAEGGIPFRNRFASNRTAKVCECTTKRSPGDGQGDSVRVAASASRFATGSQASFLKRFTSRERNGFGRWRLRRTGAWDGEIGRGGSQKTDLIFEKQLEHSRVMQ
jgi:hypothetical protein